jgi:hypothetical protein
MEQSDFDLTWAAVARAIDRTESTGGGSPVDDH